MPPWKRREACRNGGTADSPGRQFTDRRRRSRRTATLKNLGPEVGKEVQLDDIPGPGA
jgi:hypothetical protein